MASTDMQLGGPLRRPQTMPQQQLNSQVATARTNEYQCKERNWLGKVCFN